STPGNAVSGTPRAADHPPALLRGVLTSPGGRAGRDLSGTRLAAGTPRAPAAPSTARRGCRRPRHRTATAPEAPSRTRTGAASRGLSDRLWFKMKLISSLLWAFAAGLATLAVTAVAALAQAPAPHPAAPRLRTLEPGQLFTLFFVMLGPFKLLG